MKKSKLLSIMLSVAMVLTMFNQVLSLKVNAESNDVLCHISKLLDEFNQEHDTSYKLADDKQLAAVGLNVKDVEDFYKNMSDEDFYSYICTAYERDMAKRSNDNSQDNTAVDIEVVLCCLSTRSGDSQRRARAVSRLHLLCECNGYLIL